MTIIETCPKCGHDLLDSVIAVMPPISRKECTHCGWSWEGKPEDTIRDYPIRPSNAFYDKLPCQHCGNNPANGGSGICHCILGQQILL